MRKATDTIFRLLAMLQLIPVHPQTRSAAEIRQALIDQSSEFDVDIRSVQRDLEKLCGRFPLACVTKGRTHHWYWLDKSALIQIPVMDKSTALAFKLAAEYLTPLMPPSTRHLLQPYFARATEILQTTPLGKWPAKTRIIHRGPKLIPPTIQPQVQEVVYAALLEGRRFEVDYKSKGQADDRCRELNPLGIVVKNGIIYLIATSWNYQDPRHYALHRMRRANLLDSRANPVPGFDLARHVEEENMFSYPVSAGKIKLRAVFNHDAALHLTESKLSNDQKITDQKDGRMLVEATVSDTAELRWWLLGFGGAVEVVGPRALREEFSDVAEKMKSVYSASLQSKPERLK